MLTTNSDVQTPLDLRRWPPAQRCQATRTNGQPCGAWAQRGAEPPLCPVHGGRLPSLVAKAERRTQEARAALLERTQDALLSAAPDVASALVDLVLDSDVADSVRQRAAVAILDRVGVVGGQQIMVSNGEAPDPESAAQVVAKRLDRLARGLALEAAESVPGTPTEPSQGLGG